MAKLKLRVVRTESRESVVVYIVEKDAPVLQALQLLARSLGWKSFGFQSGNLFLSEPLREQLSCVVLSMDLTDIDSQHVLMELMKRVPKVGVVVTTRYIERSDDERVIDSGAAVLLMPFNSAEFKVAVEECL